MTFRYKIRTRYAETGQDGIIHHSAYIVYIEAARLEFFLANGCSIKDLEKEGIFCPVVTVSVSYLKTLDCLEDIDIEVRVESFSKVKFVLCYNIFRKEEKVATATTSHCFVNRKFKPIGIPQEVKDIFDRR